MNKSVRRVFVEKKKGFNNEAENLLNVCKNVLNIKGVEDVRVLNRYDISGISEDEYKKSLYTIFSDPTVDDLFQEDILIYENDIMFAIEYLPGQYDQRADSASECIQILTESEKPNVFFAKVIIISGKLNDEQINKIKDYCINSVDSKEASLEKPISLEKEYFESQEVEVLEGFNNLNKKELEQFMDKNNLAMSFDDLKFCQDYYKNKEKRNPTITEIKVIDTYWSDHCRHTTFNTSIEEIEINENKYSKPIKKAYESYLNGRDYVYGNNKKDICLMDIALIAMKELKKSGKIDDLDESEEINACSIEIDVNVDGEIEKWLLMFKNETHNHPTEIEPFGGAATCLGGAIRDPLSGRSYVYQAMRITGCGDPRIPIEQTIEGKLPQSKITIEAANGYSSYGNQIGVSTGQVAEIYDDGFIAKRMELGAVIAAAPKENVVRKRPSKGDVIILLGGKTGRDGCGGATGSSKGHDEKSIENSGAEVPKGNPATERKIQKLFRNPNVSTLIKKCNDFGAGGVSVAIGELCDGVDINLDLVPTKYPGLNGTELAISESQERMAVVISEKDIEKFMHYCEEENVEASVVAKVTDDKRLKIRWNDNIIVNISREFLDTNGIRQKTNAKIKSPSIEDNYFKYTLNNVDNNKDIKSRWLNMLRDLNICSQKGLVERFDSTIGAGTVLMPFGGKYQQTPAEGMVSKIPVLKGETNTVSLMTFGYNPKISKWSPFHGAVYAVVEAIAKITACGGDYKNTRLTLQEYFEKLGEDPFKWGKPLGSLLGAYYAQKCFGIPAIGGKDSMSGSFEDMNVPPTLVAFAVNTANAENIISPEFKKVSSKVILVSAIRDESEMPDFEVLKSNYDRINDLIKDGKVLSAQSVRAGGIAEAISKMSFGNKIGMKFTNNIETSQLFLPDYGSIILEIEVNNDIEKMFEGINYKVLGVTQQESTIQINDEKICIDEAIKNWEEPLEKIFNIKAEDINENIIEKNFSDNDRCINSPLIKIPKPKVFIPVFPGTNSEYDSQKAFEKAGAEVELFVFKNIKPEYIKESVDYMAEKIKKSQILMIPGGASAGDEPDGSGKFIAAVFRNPKIKESVDIHLNNNDGLILGICNGFQALIKLGLVPFGEIIDIDEGCPTLTYNKIGRHVSRMVQTKVVSNMSPWFNSVNLGEIHTVPVSHGEGRFIGSEQLIKSLFDKGQVATQYVDFNGNPSYDIRFNPNGSYHAIESITSPDGRVLGKMGHSERVGNNVAKNVCGNFEQKIFESGVKYFK